MKKLSLKKTVITQISDQEMTKVQGGTGTDYPCPSSPGLPHVIERVRPIVALGCVKS